MTAAHVTNGYGFANRADGAVATHVGGAEVVLRASGALWLEAASALVLADGPRRARVFLRFGIIEINPDGQAALFAQACAADPPLSDHLKDAAQAEVRARFVPPGNVLPLYFGSGGHPPISGR